MKQPSPQKAMAPTVSAVGAIRKSQKQLKFSPKSTATEAQRDRILRALAIRPQTSYDLRRIGCYQSAARIKELRDRFGHHITTDSITLVDRDGFWHARCALYTLVTATNGQQP